MAIGLRCQKSFKSSAVLFDPISRWTSFPQQQPREVLGRRVGAERRYLRLNGLCFPGGERPRYFVDPLRFKDPFRAPLKDLGLNYGVLRETKEKTG